MGRRVSFNELKHFNRDRRKPSDKDKLADLRLSEDNSLQANCGWIQAEAYINIATHSDGHAVYLFLERDDGAWQRRVMSVHANLERAYQVCNWYRHLIGSGEFDRSKGADAIVERIKREILNLYGDYDSDDTVLGMRPGSDGTMEEETIVPPVKKKFIVQPLHIDEMPQSVADTFREYETTVGFTPCFKTPSKESENAEVSPVLFDARNGFKYPLFTFRYTTAAYIADTLNEIWPCRLKREDIERLMREAGEKFDL